MFYSSTQSQTNYIIKLNFKILENKIFLLRYCIELDNFLVSVCTK